MNRTNRMVLFILCNMYVFFVSAQQDRESLVVSCIINNSSSNFFVQDSGASIPAGQTTAMRFDLGEQDLVLKPDNKRDFQLIISQVEESGIEQLRSELISCLIQERRIRQVDLEIIKGLKLPTTYLAPGTMALPHEIVCRRGNTVVEISDYDSFLSRGVRSEYIVSVYSEYARNQRMHVKKFGDSSAQFTSPFTPGGFCRPTETSLLIPGFTNGGTICSESYESVNFPNKAATVTRPYLVYLPHGYFDDPNKEYPLLYHLHGTPSTPEAAVDRVATLLDLMIADQRIVPMIVVFPNGNSPVNDFMGMPVGDLPDYYQAAIVVNEDTIPSFWANSAQMGNMETDVMQTLLSHVESKYQTKNGKQFRGVNGFSGGGGGHQMVLAHSDTFGSVSSNSGYGLDWQTDIDVMQLMDGIYSQLFESFGYLDPHLRDLDPFDEFVYGNVTLMPWMYAAANALAPDVSAPYGAYLPIDSDGNIDPVVQSQYVEHSATMRAALHVQDILKNKTKIYHDAGAYDFFYGWLIDYPSAYLLFDLLRLYGSYYNYSNQKYSQILTGLNIKHEFVSYKGNHNGRSNLQTMSALLFHSAIFSSNEQVDSDRIKIIGTGSLVMNEDATMVIDKGAMVGVETMGTYTKLTDINWSLQGRAKLQIGTEGRAGGVLQIGNTYDKFDLSNDPELQQHVINFNLKLNGPDAVVQVNQQGVFGMGVGVQGQASATPNQYVLNSLSNVNHIGIDIAQGYVQHSQIMPGDDARAALWAIGPCGEYDMIWDGINAGVYGGGNLVNVTDADLLHPCMTEGKFNLKSGTNVVFETDHATGTFAGPVAQGIRDIQETVQTEEVFYNFIGPVSVNGRALDEITSIPAWNLITNQSHAHFNDLNAQVMSSETGLTDDSKQWPPVGLSQDQFFDFLKLNTYNDQYKKTAPIARNNTNEATLVYLDSTIQPDAGDVIVRIPERDFPELTTGVENGVAIGSVGVVLNDPATGQRELVQVYDLEERW